MNISVIAFLLTLLVLSKGGAEVEVYRFYQTMKWYEPKGGIKEGRRTVSEPPKASLKDFPYVCLFSNANWHGKCAGTVIAPRWALTAAHCLDGIGLNKLNYVTYNSEYPYDSGDHVDIKRTFHHPGFLVRKRNTVKGVGVSELNNDIGLAYVAREMLLKLPEPIKYPLTTPAKSTPENINNLEVKVFGFSRTKTRRNRLNMELFASTIELQDCENMSSWGSCVCGVKRKGGTPAEICWGDSGGPVVYDGVQIGIVSMGPIECATRTEPSENARSIITNLRDYLTIINATVNRVPGMHVMVPDPLYSSASGNAKSLWMFFVFLFLIFH